MPNYLLIFVIIVDANIFLFMGKYPCVLKTLRF